MTAVSVILQDFTATHDLPSDNDFQTWVDTALQTADATLPESCKTVSISVINKIKSAELNKNFRKKDGPTNVLAFTYDAIPGFEPDSLGDLAICAEVVSDEADKQNKPLNAHWAHLTMHGILHLLGHDHIKENDAAAMEQLEIAALATLGFNNPYENNV